MLFDLDADPGEQRNLADQNPELVNRLLAKFEQLQSQVPDFAQPPSDYLFRPPARGQRRPLMRLIGGELRYDRIPRSQQHLIDDSKRDEAQAASAPNANGETPAATTK